MGVHVAATSDAASVYRGSGAGTNQPRKSDEMPRPGKDAAIAFRVVAFVRWWSAGSSGLVSEVEELSRAAAMSTRATQEDRQWIGRPALG